MDIKINSANLARGIFVILVMIMIYLGSFDLFFNKEGFSDKHRKIKAKHIYNWFKSNRNGGFSNFKNETGGNIVQFEDLSALSDNPDFTEEIVTKYI